MRDDKKQNSPMPVNECHRIWMKGIHHKKTKIQYFCIGLLAGISIAIFS